MWTYQAPVADQLHTLINVLDAPACWAALPAHAELDADTVAEVLAQAGRFANEVLAPLNASGDREGCRRTPEGDVVTPQGFPAAWRAFVDGGWPALASPVEEGGQGLPHTLNAALFEMLAAANHGWTMYPGLLHGACEVLRHAAVPALRERYLPPLVSGQWLATMCLTEPQAGSDLGLVRTQARGLGADAAAVVGGDPVRVSGSKIFISGGDHDLTDNIVHLVLVRLPGAPAGSRGLSLVLCPKFMPDGRRNAVHVDGIEHKMGIHGSATCQVRFDEAEGWLLAEPGKGLAAMFHMMNAARLHVAMQGLGHLDAATQNAWAYAAERHQMRTPVKPAGAHATAADPIAWHPAMRRLLLGLRAKTDAVRTIALWCGLLLDDAEHHPDTAWRATAAEHLALLTPVAKAFFTELGHRGADEALQAFGGYGFVAEYAIEQAVRDSRIALIYEGTNEIQAIDLVQRKTLDDGGTRARALIALLAEEAEACRGTPGLAPFADAVDAQLDAWRQAIDQLLARRRDDPEHALRVADDLLAGVGHALLAWAWARIARTTAMRPPAPGGRGAEAWLAAAQHGVQWVLPQARVHWHRVMQADLALPFLG